MNNWTDIVNGIFECAGMFFIIPSIFKTIKDKKVNSVSWLTVVFFTVWGLWNIYFYPYNGLMLSFIGGIGIGISNLIWFILVLKYRNNE